MDTFHPQRTMADASARHPHHQASSMISCRSLTVPELGRLVDQLIESWIYVIGKLYLRDRLHALRSSADCKSDDALLTQRRVEHAFRAKIYGEV